MSSLPRPSGETRESLWSSRDQRRSDCLRRLRETALASKYSGGGATTQGQRAFEDTLRDKTFANNFFNLFDQDGTGALDQTDFFETLRVNIRSPNFGHLTQDARCDLADLLECVTYLICQDGQVTQEHFVRIINGRSVPTKLFRLADFSGTSRVGIEELMKFLILITKPRCLEEFNPAQVKALEEVFRRNLPPGQDQLTLDQFRRLMPTKNAFFVERAFAVFDRDSSGEISLAEFLDSMRRYSRDGPSEKIVFLFKIYDIDGDGRLQRVEIESVMRACVRESGMELPESDVTALADALYSEAAAVDRGSGDRTRPEQEEDPCTGGEAGGPPRDISIDQLKEVFSRHPGLIENLTFSLSSWLLSRESHHERDDIHCFPKPNNENRSRGSNLMRPNEQQGVLKRLRNRISLNRLLNQWQLCLFIGLFALLNVMLGAFRAAEFVHMRNIDGSTPNIFYMISRACGRCLLLDSVLVFCLVLRYSMTRLRSAGAAAVLPLDHHVYLHKMVGWTILALAWAHTLMHLCTFTFNVTPDPLKFVQINSRFWEVGHEVVQDDDETKPNWMRLGYNAPPGCSVVACNLSDVLPATPAKMCQECREGSRPYSASDWLLTAAPGVFGLLGGWANPTGVALIAALTVMAMCSSPLVRKKGYFEVFYFTHLLYWCYVILLVLHAPTFWKWILLPMSVFAAERLYRACATLAGRGKSVVLDGVTMASRVTKLVIRRPPNFKHSPGDWLFLRIPAVARFEWHPFTISSAPESADSITVHVRGVGEWTNRLYALFEDRKTNSSRARSHQYRGAGNYGYDFSLDDVSYSFYSIQENTPENLEIYLDGPFGAPATDIFRAEHAVLVATGIGVTPFSSILQSIMHRYLEAKRVCPNCSHKWCVDLGKSMMNLKKVDFFWINRDQKSFEWFVTLLDRMELEQEEAGCKAYSSNSSNTPCNSGSDEQQQQQQQQRAPMKFLDFHLYFTSALQRTDMRAVGLQLAMDLIHKKEQRDVMTKLKVRTHAGRPNWQRVFNRIRDANMGRVTVFYCGNPQLGKVLRRKCDDFGFKFRKENF